MKMGYGPDNLSGGRPDKVEATAMPGAFTTFTFSPKAEDAEETHHIEQVLYDMRHGFRGSRIDYTQLEEAVKSIRKHGYGRCRLCGRNAPSINRRLMIVCNKTCGGNTRYGGRAKHSAFDTSVECLIKLSKAYKYTNHRSMCTVCAESHCGEGLPEDCLSTPFSARSEKGVHGRNGRVGNKNRKAYKTVAGLFGYEEGAHELNCAKEDLKELVRNQKLILCYTDNLRNSLTVFIPHIPPTEQRILGKRRLSVDDSIEPNKRTCSPDSFISEFENSESGMKSGPCYGQSGLSVLCEAANSMESLPGS